MSKTVPLELSIHFNGQLLTVVPLEIPIENALSNRSDGPAPAVIDADRAGKPIRIVLRLDGNPACAVGHGVIEVPISFSGPQCVTWPNGPTTTYRYEYKLTDANLLQGRTQSFVYDGQQRLVEVVDTLGRTTTVTYDCDGNRHDSIPPSSDSPREDPPEDPPNIVGN